jgi:murein L,D-transpeptidase YafK
MNKPRLLILILFSLVLIASQVSSAERTAKLADTSANSIPSQPIAQRQALQQGPAALCESGTGVPPVNHAQDARATFRLHQYLQLPLRQPKIVVKKSQRQLLLFSADKLVRTYHIGLGLSPVGDKVRQGDRRTPEGEFYVFTKNERSAFYLSLGLSYPNAAHAERGLRDGLITKAQYESIMRALRAKKTPPQNTRLGGDIYIHGNGAQSDWTWGCAALENAEMLELFKAVTIGTPVTIEP